MRQPYTRELEELPTTFKTANAGDVTELRSLLLELGGASARMVGTGGTTPVAVLASSLHETLSRQPARTMTPLELLQTPVPERSGAVLFSARARHPDARLVLDRFATESYRPAALVTHRPSEELRDALDPVVRIVHLQPPAMPEGFLATNSVLAMCVALIRAALGEVLPGDLLNGADELVTQVDVRDRLLVLYPPRLAAVAADVETRCAEIGLAAVQATDLRNIAHGRHTGLARVADSTSVIVLSDESSVALADAVSEPLKASGAALSRWHVDRPWPEAVIRMMVASMHLTARLSQGRIDPARPKVPDFGRRLYHLPLRRLLAPTTPSPVDRKLAALGVGATGAPARLRYEDAFAEWRAALRRVDIEGLVLDYDGTVCETSRRFSPPSEDIRAALIHLLDSGLRIGFASGRGKSLHEGLRQWVPEPLQKRVTLGLYNGAVIMSLYEDLTDLTTPSELMERVAERVSESELFGLVELEVRQHQVSIAADVSALFHFQRLAQLVRDVLARAPSLPVQVVSSGHSVDVIARETSKVRVYEAVSEAVQADVVAMGDQGDSGGNDFALLDATRWSISVDRCSANPTRCWHVDPAGRRGPQSTTAVLEAIKASDGRGRLDVRDIRKGRRTRA